MAPSILKNITWLGAGNMVVKPLWFVFITAVCVRTLGVEQYGVMTATLALSFIVGSVITLGTSQFSIREIARDHGLSQEFFSNLFTLRALMSLLALGVMLLLGLGLGYRGLDLMALVFAACYVFLLNLTEYCRAFFRAFEVLRYEAVSVILEKIAVIGLGTVFLVAAPRTEYVLGGMALGMALTLVGNVGWLTTKLTSFRSRLINTEFLRRALPQAIPLGLASIFAILYFRADSVMLEAIQGELVTGQYGLAFRIIESLILAPFVIVAVLLPRLSSLYSDGDLDAFARLMKQGVASLALISLGIALTLTFTAPLLIGLLDAEQLSGPTPRVLQILAWTFPFACINYLFTTSLTATHDQKALAWILGAAALLNLGLNGVLITMYSLYGACATALMTQIGITVALGLRIRRTRPFKDSTMDLTPVGAP